MNGTGMQLAVLEAITLRGRPVACHIYIPVFSIACIICLKDPVVL